MKTYIKYLSLSVVTALISICIGGHVSAADTLPQITKTIVFNKKTYTLNTCNSTEVSSFLVKAQNSIKTLSYSEKRRTFIKLKLLQASWQKTCNTYIATLQNQTTSPTYTPDFVVVNNPIFIDGLSSVQKEKAKERAYKYINSAESIVDDMISKGILTSADKTMIKGKIQLQYVNTCEQIDGLTTIKYYDLDKITSKDSLVSILLNVSVCGEASFDTLFNTSYKHVLIHELGHYIYFLKDQTRDSFTGMCRENQNKKKGACISYDTFFSKYAMTDAQEDYAESFAYWYLGKKPEFPLTANTNITTLQMKLGHFNTLFK